MPFTIYRYAIGSDDEIEDMLADREALSTVDTIDDALAFVNALYADDPMYAGRTLTARVSQPLDGYDADHTVIIATDDTGEYDETFFIVEPA